MAKKANSLKLALETLGQNELTNRLPPKVSPALYLMQLRLPKVKPGLLRKKLPVDMDSETRAQIEHPVKIRHVA